MEKKSFCDLKVVKLTLRILSMVIGLVFIFSGFVKAIDPLGSTYKFVDYFEKAFHIGQLAPTAFPLAILLATIEFIVGIMLVFKLQFKLAAWGALLFMALFTPVTLYIAITNSVTDCGCFGDALKVTNWGTFYKNVIITFIVLPVFFRRKTFTTKLGAKLQWLIILAFTLLITAFQFYNYAYLPVIDFRPYKVGSNIPEKMKIPDGMPVDSFETTLTYKNINTNEVKDFNLNNYPWEDSTWVWVDTKNKLVKEGYKPEIHDFNISDSSGTDITEVVLSSTDPVFLIISYKIEKAAPKNFLKFADILNFATQNNIQVYTLTASGNDQATSLISKTGLQLNFYTTDEITLKTIIRSNPGLVLLKNGTVKGLWHHNKLPEIEKLNNLIKQ